MNPRMTERELQLFKSFVDSSYRYLEFGSGGSTIVASQFAKEWIMSVDSSREWLNSVDEECNRLQSTTPRTLLHIDIGDLSEWGFPKDDSKKSMWPAYYFNIWTIEQSHNTDLVFVDGRFRVATVLSTILHITNPIIIMIHDFKSRDYYKIINSFATQVAVCEDLSAFLAIPNRAASVIETLQHYAYDAR